MSYRLSGTLNWFSEVLTVYLGLFSAIYIFKDFALVLLEDFTSTGIIKYL